MKKSTTRADRRASHTPSSTARRSRCGPGHGSVSVLLALTALAATGPAAAAATDPTSLAADRRGPVTDAAELRVRGRASRDQSTTRGGRWEMTGGATNTLPERDPAPWHGFELASTSSSAGAGCLCGNSIFADGFESGDTSAWSGVAP